MPVLDRSILAAQVLERIAACREQLTQKWGRDPISNLVLDDLFPLATARALFEAFPTTQQLSAKRNLRESRYVGACMEAYSPLVREAVYAFQSPRVIEAIGSLTGWPKLLLTPQPNACGISRMERGSFLNPHLDSAHDPEQRKSQVLSVLYYLTPDLRLADGGHLELWHDGPDAEATTILSKFNRLVVMATHAAAWHSVSPLRTNRQRCCIWSYCYAPHRAQPHNDNHVASFRGRPEQKLRDLLLRADTFARQSLYRFGLERGWVDPEVWLDHDPLDDVPANDNTAPSAARAPVPQSSREHTATPRWPDRS